MFNFSLKQVMRIPEEEEEYAFWSYDLFPNFLSSKIKGHLPNGRVSVEHYHGLRITPFYIAKGARGKELHELRIKIDRTYTEYLEEAKGAAYSVFEALLKERNFPVSSLGFTRERRSVGMEYVRLFKNLLDGDKA